MSEELNQDVELEPSKPTAEGLVAAVLALEEIKRRSFSGRNPELGRMVNCKVCSLRHRDSIKCEQKFKELWIEEDLETGEKVTVYATAVQPKDTEIRGQLSAQQPTFKQAVGAAGFKGKRLNPHPNKRKLQFVELVRALLPDEYDEADLKKAQAKARRVIVKKFGRRGFLPPVWQRKPEEVAGV